MGILKMMPRDGLSREEYALTLLSLQSYSDLFMIFGSHTHTWVHDIDLMSNFA